MKINQPGIYEMTDEEYHADPVIVPSLSSSIAKLFIEKTPRHAWMRHPRLNPKFEPEERQTFDLGTAAHCLLLHDTKLFEIIKAPDFRTNAAKEARDGARLAGKIPLLEKQWDDVQAMAIAIRAQLVRHAEAAGAFENGKPEQTLIWQEAPGIWCRARLDWLHDGPTNVYHDFKSTGASASPDEWGKKSLFDLGYDIQAALYCRGIRAVLGIERPHFRFIVAENYAPYAMAVHELDPMAFALAEHKVEEALQYWGWCLRNGAWPGYSRHVHYIEAPPWRAAQVEARMTRRGDATTEEILRAAMDWQAPLGIEDGTAAVIE